MNRITNAAKLDFMAAKSMLKLIAILVLLAVVIGVAAHGSSYAMLLTMVFAVTSCGSIFSVHEKSNSIKLYGILPLKKSEMILGRYLYALIIGLVYIVIAGLLGFILSLFGTGDFNTLSYWAALAFGFVYFGFAVGVSYPTYFKFTFAKANVFTMLPMYLIAVAFLLVTRKTNLTSDIVPIIKFFTENLVLVPIFGLLSGLILLAISVLISNLIYTRKEI